METERKINLKENFMTQIELNEIEVRLNKAQKGIWKAYIEGRDHTSGSNFIKTGIGTDNENDIELYGATYDDYDFIANAKQDISKLIAEIRRLMNQ